MITLKKPYARHLKTGTELHIPKTLPRTCLCGAALHFESMANVIVVYNIDTTFADRPLRKYKAQCPACQWRGVVYGRTKAGDT